MREILYKAMTTGINEWITGYYAGDIASDSNDNNRTSFFIVDNLSGKKTTYYVWKKTICQHTGKHDKNKQRIFEYDKVLCAENGLCVVKWDNDTCAFYLVSETDTWHLNEFEQGEMEVIGNIHD